MNAALRRYWLDACIALAIFAGNVVLLLPHLRTDFTSQAWNNDYILIAISRMFREVSGGWNPLWYCGMPARYAYPPFFHLLVTAAPVASLGRAYHIASGLGYALVPAALYVTARTLFRGRLIAFVTATAWCFFPSLIYLFPSWANLARGSQFAPWPFLALVGHGEAPHTLSLAIIPLAAACAWRNRCTAAAVLAALVFLTNWPGIAGLLIALASVGVAKARELGYRQTALRILTIVALGYGLSAFWMTPGFVHSTAMLSRIAGMREQTPAPWGAGAGAVIAIAAALLLLATWKRIPPQLAFGMTWVALSGAPVAAFTLFGAHAIPMPWRYVLEFNMGLVFLAGAIACVAGRWRIPLLLAALLLGGFAGRDFLRNAWKLQPASVDVSSLLPYQISEWLARNAAGSRVFLAGELSQSINAFASIPQVLGGQQGVSNLLIEGAHKEVMQDCRLGASANEVAELWLRALHSGYVVVDGPESSEHFHWYVDPQRFSGLERAWSNGKGDEIYRLPQAGAEAVVVDKNALDRLPALRSTADLEFLRAYVRWAQGVRPAEVKWLAADRADVEADLQPNEAVLVKVNYDRGWRAACASTRPDPIGFLLLEPQPGLHKTAVAFGAAWDVWLGRALALISLLLIVMEFRRPGKLAWVAPVLILLPAGVAYLVLAAREPPQIRVAEQTFERVRPPLIGAGGIVAADTFAPPLKTGVPASIFGQNFGAPRDDVRVWVGRQPARILYRSATQLNVELPAGAPDAAEIAVEVNGCRGNSFAAAIQH